MPTLRASVLVIAHPEPAKIAFGADFAESIEDARKQIREFRYPVIAFPSLPSSKTPHAPVSLDQNVRHADVIALLDFANSVSPLSQRVVIQNDTPAEELREIINMGSVFRILSSWNDERFELTIQEALEEYRLLQQNGKLLQLINEQNERLKKLSTELEERVDARRRALEESRKRLLMTNHRAEALHRALVAIHRAGSIGEMENLTNDSLKNVLGLTWTRILFNSQARLNVTSGEDGHSSAGVLGQEVAAVHSAPLMRGKETLGVIYFARGPQLPFSRDENSFLGQIADAVALAIDRLTKLEQSETLKHQWEATFDAILDPVSIITHDYTLARINRSFAQRSGGEPEKVIGRKCYEALFSRTSPCEGCELEARGSNFRLKPAKTTGGIGREHNTIYDVFSQEIQFKPDGRALFVNMYHDISAQLRLERQILESAKMAELGTIGSSIAHELNNPLGGMLSFLQLIKMDLKGHEPWYQDIDEMEKGARRCRDIVESLLGFTRKGTVDIDEDIDLREVIEQALKITELQTRSMGISMTLILPPYPIEARGQFNQLAQALRNFLQNAQEAIAEEIALRLRDVTRLENSSKYSGEIKIEVEINDSWAIVIINDNGTGFDPALAEQIFDPMYTTKNTEINPGLGLTVAQQIIRDHGGKLEITSTKGSGTRAKISLPRLHSEGVSSSF